MGDRVLTRSTVGTMLLGGMKRADVVAPVRRVAGVVVRRELPRVAATPVEEPEEGPEEVS